MASMTHRTTFSLDDQAIHRLQTLSKRWKVSQAEVVRRALEVADRLPEGDNPLVALRRYHEQGGLSAERANEYLREWAESRNEWGHE
jgi:hypothetical protein